MVNNSAPTTPANDVNSSGNSPSRGDATENWSEMHQRLDEVKEGEQAADVEMTEVTVTNHRVATNAPVPDKQEVLRKLRVAHETLQNELCIILSDENSSNSDNDRAGYFADQLKKKS